MPRLDLALEKRITLEVLHSNQSLNYSIVDLNADQIRIKIEFQSPKNISTPKNLAKLSIELNFVDFEPGLKPLKKIIDIPV